jgi:hypothetical protein
MLRKLGFMGVAIAFIGAGCDNRVSIQDGDDGSDSGWIDDDGMGDGDDDDDGRQDDDGGGSAGKGAGADVPTCESAAVNDIVAACGAIPNKDPAASDAEALSQTLVGRWRTCTDDAHLFTPEAVGIAFLPGGRFHELVQTDTGIACGEGWSHSGNWQVEDMSHMNGPGSYALTLESDDGWWSSRWVHFANDATVLSLDYESLFVPE